MSHDKKNVFNFADMKGRTAFIAIGRNEGKRLKRCLESLKTQGDHIVYVDSGSSDGSIAFAQSINVEVVALDMTTPFTAARARNAGVDRILEIWPDTEYLQFIDADCTLDPVWIEKGLEYLCTNTDYVVVRGIVNEIYPEKNIYHSLAQRGWNPPSGDVLSCGGIALMRRSAFHEAGEFNEALIAGEEPELCIRLREHGGKIVHIDVNMAHHDIAMHRLAQWWQRSKRTGYAYAEVSDMHKNSDKCIWKKETRRALAWGALGPLIIISAFLVSKALVVLLMIFPLQIIRVARNLPAPHNFFHAALYIFGRMPEFIGVMTFKFHKMTHKKPHLLEYK